MDISIIIVSYNTRDVLVECLDAIEKFPPKKLFEVIIVDNASTDGTIEEIKNKKSQPKADQPLAEKIKNLKIIENEENVGFSKANNIGVKQAKGKYILFLNSDAIVRDGTLDYMLAFMDSHKDVAAATCKVLLPSGVIDDASHRGFPTPWNALTYFSGLSRLFPKSKLFAGYSLGSVDMNKPHEIDALAGAFMLVRREAGDEVGWWDEDYFFYGEDIDFCYKLKKQGWKIYYVPQVSILHYKSVSSGLKKDSQHLTSATKETRIRATKARFEAMRIFYRKHYLKKYPKFVTWLIEAGIKLKEISA